MTQHADSAANDEAAKIVGAGEVGADFRHLLAWKKVQDLADAIAESIESLPRGRATEAIAFQVMRAAGSVSANIAEGYGRHSPVGFRHHLSIARGSCFEVESWLDLLLRRHDLTETSASRLTAVCKEVRKLITEKIRSMEALDPYAVGEDADEPRLL